MRELAASLEARVGQRTTALTQEIERRTQAEALLRQSEELYRFTIDLNAQVPWSSTANGTPISIGERWTEVSGISFKEFTVRGWKGIAHADDYDVIAKARASVIVQGSPFDMEFRVRTADGSYRWLRSRGAPRRDADGKVLQWYGTIENVDARRKTEAEFNRLQSELIHVSRVSAMGTMASTLAHELNQPLTAIANYVRGSRRMLGELTGETVTIVQDALAQADASASKAGEIVRRLRELVASGDVQRRAESIPDLVRQASNMVLDDARSLGIAYTIDLDPQAATANADRIQVQQVLINLLRNAVEALSPTGVRHIVIQTRRVGAHCEISVRDTGPGISGEVAKRLFEPFYSTKSACMGVGLSISRTIVEAHGGQIWHDPHPGGGTTFRFTLPVAPVSITGAAAPAGAKPA
ncbi:MAG TPA: ATP-binding protein [Polymorphobacter sp.]|nr:ATP-binding protein [Polymorphobacter sp.]